MKRILSLILSIVMAVGMVAGMGTIEVSADENVQFGSGNIGNDSFLASDGENLYYYDTNESAFYRSDMDLNNRVKIVDYDIFYKPENLVYHNGVVYFSRGVNMISDCLYQLDIVTGEVEKVENNYGLAESMYPLFSDSGYLYYLKSNLICRTNSDQFNPEEDAIFNIQQDLGLNQINFNNISLNSITYGDNKIFFSTYANSKYYICSINFDGSDFRQIIKLSRKPNQMCYADGYLFVRIGGEILGGDVYRYNLNGEGETNFLGDEFPGTDSTMDAYDGYLYFTSKEDDRHLYRKNVSGGSIEELYIRNMDEIKSGLDNRISIINDSIYHVGRYPEDGIYKLDVDISENSRDIISTPTPTQAPTPTPTQAPNQTANDNVDAGAGTSVILYTDIASYINNYPIPSYAYNGKMVVIAEDLRNYGFNVTWDEGSRSLYIEPNYETTVIQGMGTVYSNRDKHGQIFAYAIPSNIKTYLCGDEIPSININGYTMVAIEDLENFDIGTEFTYYDSIRSLKLTENWTETTEYQPLPSAPVMADGGSGTIRVPASSTILYTDIASYINNYPIPSYAYNGKMVVVAEDLRNYGFKVTWNEGSRSLYIEPNYETTVIQGMGTVYSNRDKHGQVFAYTIPSNIKAYLCGEEIPSVNINGYTMVAIEDLENFDIGTEFTYYDSIRSLKLTETWTKATEYLPLPSAPGSNYVNVYTVDGDYCGTENNKGGIESVRWTLDSAGTLTISGNGEMVRNWYANKSQIRGWHEYASMITSVVIDEGVTNIGAYSFENCTNLQRIYIPGSVVEMHGDVAGNITQPITVYYDGTRDEFTKIGGYDKFPAGTTYSLPRTPVVAQPTENVNNYNVGSYAGVYQKGDICIAVLFSTGSTSEESECYIRQVSYPYRDSNNIATADTIKDFETAQKISGNAYYIDTSDLQCELTFGNETITLSGTDARYSEYYGEYEKVSNMGPNMRQEDIWIK